MIAIGSDHGGYRLKKEIEKYLEEKDNSIKFDESKTLYNLLRNAIYKQYLEE